MAFSCDFGASETALSRGDTRVLRLALGHGVRFHLCGECEDQEARTGKLSEPLQPWPHGNVIVEIRARAAAAKPRRRLSSWFWRLSPRLGSGGFWFGSALWLLTVPSHGGGTAGAGTTLLPVTGHSPGSGSHPVTSFSPIASLDADLQTEPQGRVRASGGESWGDTAPRTLCVLRGKDQSGSLWALGKAL